MNIQVTTPRVPLTKEGLDTLFENIAQEKMTILDGTGCNKDDFHITVTDASMKAVSKIEGDDWFNEIHLPEGLHCFVRGGKLGDADILTVWTGKLGQAHHDLREFQELLGKFFSPEGGLEGFRIKITEAAQLTGYLFKDEGEYFNLLQLPVWVGAGEKVTGRTPYTLEELLAAGEQELFLNNAWLTLVKENEGYRVIWDAERAELVVLKKVDAFIDIADLPLFTIGNYEEVNYNSPVMAELGLLPPGEKAPVLVHQDATGRQTAVIEELLDGSTYLTYVMGHKGNEIADQVTLGPDAVHSEQLIEVLIHRYGLLNEQIPHEANVKTIALLQEVKALQEARYAERADQAAQAAAEQCQVDNAEPTGSPVEKEIIKAPAIDEANLPRDTEGNVADIELENN